MTVPTTPTTLAETAPAKLNLALHVRGRDADGYHRLETIFAFVGFGDVLHFEPASTLTLTITGPFAPELTTGALATPGLATPELATGDNLVLRAVRALAAASGKLATGALRLEKHIPVAAGLGGGSADAAAALRLLARYWRLDWPLARLATLAAGLGADVPACVLGNLQLGSGRGEVLTPLSRPALHGTPVLLVNPRVAVPTGPVFAGWNGIDRGGLDPQAPLDELRNDLAASAVLIAPVIATVLAALGEMPGVTLSRMSGSGATGFGLFESESARDAAAAAIAARHPHWWQARTNLL